MRSLLDNNHPNKPCYRPSARGRLAASASALLLAGAVLLAGCGTTPAVVNPPAIGGDVPKSTLAATSTGSEAPTATAAPSTPTPAPSPTPEQIGADWDRVRPNELGRIMVLEYHMIGEEEDRWTRSYENFWADLELLYEKGYRPVGLHDILDNKIDIPAGYSPVVLTFDDSSPMQFKMIEDANGNPIPDPQSAVGMLERFHELHPDWPLKATFFVLPAADKPHDFFGQDEYKAAKLRHLVEKGFDIGNHTLWHQRLDALETAEEVAEQLGRAVAMVQEHVPSYQVRTLALPLGMWPKNPDWARYGVYEGTEYRHEMVLEVTGGPAPAPDSHEFDPYSVPRIQATNMDLDYEEAYIAYFDANPQERYVSDGNPDLLVFPVEMEAQFRPNAGYEPVELPGETAQAYRAYRLR